MNQQPVNNWNQPVPPREPGAQAWGAWGGSHSARISFEWAPGLETEVRHRGHHIGNIIEDASSDGESEYSGDQRSYQLFKSKARQEPLLHAIYRNYEKVEEALGPWGNPNPQGHIDNPDKIPHDLTDEELWENTSISYSDLSEERLLADDPEAWENLEDVQDRIFEDNQWLMKDQNRKERCEGLNYLLSDKLHSDYDEALDEWKRTFKSRSRFGLEFDPVLDAEAHDRIEALLKSYCADYYLMFALDEDHFLQNPHKPVEISKYHDWTQSIFKINGFEYWFSLWSCGFASSCDPCKCF